MEPELSATCTINGTAFNRMSSSATRKCISCQPEAAEFDQREYHPPGATGSIDVSLGRKSRTITARMRYIGTSLSNAGGMFTADWGSWEGSEVAITDEFGNSYARCWLVSMKITRKPTALGRSGRVFFDAEAVFKDYE